MLRRWGAGASVGCRALGAGRWVQGVGVLGCWVKAIAPPIWVGRAGRWGVGRSAALGVGALGVEVLGVAR